MCFLRSDCLLHWGCNWWSRYGVSAFMNRRIYTFLMTVGSAAGCHQLPERSFFFHGHQFPVCARCTGVILGQIAGGIASVYLLLPYDTISFLCFLMFFDWWLQRVHLLQSTNLRRLITGVLCGFAVGNAYAQIIRFLWGFLSKSGL